MDPHISHDGKLNEGYVSKKKDDSLIKSWIYGTLNEKVLYIVNGLSTATQILKALKGVLA